MRTVNYVILEQSSGLNVIQISFFGKKKLVEETHRNANILDLIKRVKVIRLFQGKYQYIISTRDFPQPKNREQWLLTWDNYCRPWGKTVDDIAWCTALPWWHRRAHPVPKPPTKPSTRSKLTRDIRWSVRAISINYLALKKAIEFRRGTEPQIEMATITNYGRGVKITQVSHKHKSSFYIRK